MLLGDNTCKDFHQELGIGYHPLAERRPGVVAEMQYKPRIMQVLGGTIKAFIPKFVFSCEYKIIGHLLNLYIWVGAKLRIPEIPSLAASIENVSHGR